MLPLVVSRHLRGRWVVAVLLAVVVTAAAGSALERWQRESDQRDELAALGGPFPLTDGRTLDSPLPGWRHRSTSIPSVEHGLPLRLHWRTGDGTAEQGGYVVVVTRRSTTCGTAGDEPVCTVLDHGAHGPVTAHVGGHVFVRVDGLEWWVEGLDDATAVQVLDRTTAVGVDEFWRAARRAGQVR